MATPTMVPQFAAARPTGKPGELQLADGRIIRLVEWREGDFYDTVFQPGGAISAGTSLELFRDLQFKSLQHTNLKTPRRIPANSEFIMNRVGVVINQALQNLIVSGFDILKTAYAGSLNFKINDRLITEGPVVIYQSGYGMSGNTTETTTSILTTGVPSAAAAPQLLVAQNIGDQDDLQATIDFKSSSWTGITPEMPVLEGNVENGIGFTLYLHGFIKKPQGS